MKPNKLSQVKLIDDVDDCGTNPIVVFVACKTDVITLELEWIDGSRGMLNGS